MALSDVGRDRHCCPLNLTDQPIAFAFGQKPCYAVAFDNQRHSLLPDLKVTVTLYGQACWHLKPDFTPTSSTAAPSARAAGSRPARKRSTVGTPSPRR